MKRENFHRESHANIFQCKETKNITVCSNISHMNFPKFVLQSPFLTELYDIKPYKTYQALSPFTALLK